MGVEKERENVLSCPSPYPSEISLRSIYLTINIGGRRKQDVALSPLPQFRLSI